MNDDHEGFEGCLSQDTMENSGKLIPHRIWLVWRHKQNVQSVCVTESRGGRWNETKRNAGAERELIKTRKPPGGKLNAAKLQICSHVRDMVSVVYITCYPGHFSFFKKKQHPIMLHGKEGDTYALTFYWKNRKIQIFRAARASRWSANLYGNARYKYKSNHCNDTRLYMNIYLYSQLVTEVQLTDSWNVTVF